MEIPMLFKCDSVIDLVRVGLVSPGLKFFHSIIFSDSKSTMWLLTAVLFFVVVVFWGFFGNIL